MTIVSDLRNLGLREGDVVMVRAAPAAMVPGKKGPRSLHAITNAAELKEAVLEVIGCQGTLIAQTFTASQFWRKSSPRTVFTPTAPTITGAFAAAVLRHESSLRSAHPFNSIAAIGPDAAYLCQGHDERALSFSWIARLIELGGKLVVIGCVDSSPGFSTVHYAQERLGLSTRFLFRQAGTYIRKPDGREEWITRPDTPGCSMGFHRLYGAYVRAGIIFTGYVGEAYSILARATETFQIDLKVLASDPRAVLCERLSCPSCATRTYSLHRLPLFGFAQLAKRMARE
jgi:aminoglycoside N3'-acetyltransferase